MKKYFFLLFKTSIFLLLASYVSFSCNPPSKEAKAYHSFTPGMKWYDSDSIHINAHGGGIINVDQTYYWFGEFKIAGKKGNSAQVGVSCYSSNDLYNWKNEGIVLKVSEEPSSDIQKGCIIERPKVIYNKKTNKYIMWFHLELKDNGYTSARTGLAVSDKVIGPYRFIKSLRPNKGQWPLDYPSEFKTKNYSSQFKWWTPEWSQAIDEGLLLKRDFENGQMSRDMTIFVDDNEKAYHIHSSEDNLTLHLSELTDDYSDFTGNYIRLFPGGHNEAPAMFKNNDTYYLITSGCTGWNPNTARLFRAKSIWGPWESLGNPCIGKNSDLTFLSQGTYVIPVKDKQNAFIFMGDRWQPENPIDGRYIWLPIKFINEKPLIQWREEWDLSIF